jgi:hypothetical protein
LHLHTHHHHHIHNSNSSSLLKSLNPTTISLSPEKSSLPLNVNNVIKKEHEKMSPSIENQVLNLSTNIKKPTRRKSSPVKRRINSGTKSNR